jgi:hypothetical protein
VRMLTCLLRMQEIAFSDHRTEQLRKLEKCDLNTLRSLIRWNEEQQQLESAMLLVRTRKARLDVFIPLAEVGVFVRLEKVLGFVGLLPIFRGVLLGKSVFLLPLMHVYASLRTLKGKNRE